MGIFHCGFKHPKFGIAVSVCALFIILKIEEGIDGKTLLLLKDMPVQLDSLKKLLTIGGRVKLESIIDVSYSVT